MPMQWQNLLLTHAEALDAPNLFDSAAWAAAMACLGARCWLGNDHIDNRRASLFVWQKGPVRIGYVGFPVSPTWLLTSTHWRSSTTLNLPERVDLLRANFSMLDSGALSARSKISLPESAIPELAAWPIRNQRKNRKDLALAIRHGVILCNATSQDADTMFAIYEDTVLRHRGRLRYSLDYFKAVTTISEGGQDVQVRIARHQQQTIGFCVTAKQAQRGYYLHAGVKSGYRQLGAADLLADDSIQWAISNGCRSFSMMASPPDQLGLHKFKQKWTENDGQWITVDTPNGFLGRLATLALSLGR